MGPERNSGGPEGYSGGPERIQLDKRGIQGGLRGIQVDQRGVRTLDTLMWTWISLPGVFGWGMQMAREVSGHWMPL